MRLDRKRDAELARRKGLTTRTIIQFLWLGISAFLAYLAIDWLFDSGQLSYEFFYSTLFIPRSVPEIAILAALVLVVVAIMQFFLVLGYAIASPQGRERSGNPSPYSTTYDPMQDDYRR
jgi:TRAP-type C4-dicarboxylate transport system permease small subunit